MAGWTFSNEVGEMKTLLVGFDSAWSAKNRGGIVAALRNGDGTYQEFDDLEPKPVNFIEAIMRIQEWQAQSNPCSTLILIDQPTVVKNKSHCRPIEYAVSPSVGRRGGGMQPAHRGRVELFGDGAPIWNFLDVFRLAAMPFDPLAETQVMETYPVLTIMARGWKFKQPPEAPRIDLLRLPKYNPAGKFYSDDWNRLCAYLATEIEDFGLNNLGIWIRRCIGKDPKPSKSDQDCLDACLCLLAALHLIESKPCLLAGSPETGCIIVPYNEDLKDEIILNSLRKAKPRRNASGLRERLRAMRFEKLVAQYEDRA